MNNSNEKEISIIDLINVLRKDFAKIIIAGIITALLAFSYTKLFVTPLYQSNAKMVIKVITSDTLTTYSDVQIAVGLVNDCVEIIKSRQIMQKVIDKLDLDCTPEQLLGSISITVPQDTRVLRLSVVNPNPETAKEIAEKVCETTEEYAGDYVGVDSIKTFEVPSTPIAPVSPNVLKNTFLGGFAGAFLMAAVSVLISIFNRKITTQDDAERLLGLTVFSSIPYSGDEEETEEKKDKASAGKDGKKNG